MFPSKSVYPSSTADTPSILRVPPNSSEAETSLLGSLLLNNLSFDDVSEILYKTDFYSQKNGIVFEAIKTLIMDRSPADVVTVHAYLERAGKATEVGGIAFLNQLANSVPSAATASIRSYAEIVQDRSVRRSLIKAGDAISDEAYSSSASVEDLQSDAEQKLSEACSSKSSVSSHDSMDELMDNMLDEIMEKCDNPGSISGVSTGFINIDSMTGGLQPGQFVVIAARPSMGKTALAVNIAENASLNQGLPTLIISLEMKAGSLLKRIVSSVGKIDQTKMRDGKLTTEEFKGMMSLSPRIKQSKLEIIDSGVSTVSAIRRSARQAMKKHGGLSLVVVDYMQMMVSDKQSNENRTIEISNISRGLKLLACEIGCPVIALSQLNRNLEQRPDKRPMMSDLRDSGSIEQDADIIMFIYRDEYYTKESSKCPGVAEIIIAKQRSGATGTVNLTWTPAYTRFDNLA